MQTGCWPERLAAERIFRIDMGRSAAESTIICHPIRTRVADDRRVSFLHFELGQPESHPGNLRKQFMAKILHTGRAIENAETKNLASSVHVVPQSLVERVMNIDQHPVVVVRFQPGLDLRIKITEQGTDVSVALNIEEAPHSVAMAVQITAFILQRFIAMSSVELVLLLNDHDSHLKKTINFSLPS